MFPDLNNYYCEAISTKTETKQFVVSLKSETTKTRPKLH